MAKGRKTGGGSRKGKRNKRTLAQIDAGTLDGISPLDYLLGIMRGTIKKDAAKLSAAIAAAPYVHSKLATIKHQGDQEQPIINKLYYERGDPDG